MASPRISANMWQLSCNPPPICAFYSVTPVELLYLQITLLSDTETRFIKGKSGIYGSLNSPIPKWSKVVSQNRNQEARRTFQLSETWKEEARRTSEHKILDWFHQKFSCIRYVFDFQKKTWNFQICQRNKLLSMFSKFSSWFFSLVLVEFRSFWTILET